MASMKPFFVAQLLGRDGGECHYCSVELIFGMDNEGSDNFGTIDHKHPRSRGGTWEWDNLVLACARCNHTKADIPYEYFRWYLQMAQLGYDRHVLKQMIEKSYWMKEARAKKKKPKRRRTKFMREKSHG